MSYPGTEVWKVEEQEFPRSGTIEEKLRHLVRYAILAPSGHNTQPWRFAIENERIHLFADRSRSLRVIDPRDRELTISCGAAVFFLRVALRHFGYVGTVSLLPDADRPDLLATIGLGEHAVATVEEEALFLTIPERRTHRAKFEDRPLPGALLNALRYGAATEGARLRVIEDPDTRRAIASLVAEADRRQFADREFRAELSAWVHPNRSDRRDGIPGYGFGLSDLASHLSPYVMRTFNLGTFQADRDRRLVLRAPALIVLGTPGDGRADWLRAGGALARVLLRAQSEGVYASHLNQPVELAELRARLRAVIECESGYPQVLLRMGYGHDRMPTPRRGLTDVVSE